MNAVNFELAYKQRALDAAQCAKGVRPTASRPEQRPSVAAILLATAVQILVMAALLGSVASALQ